MANLNRCLLIGNLTREVELRYTPKGTAVAEISLAINRHYTGDNGEKKEETTFVDVTLWGRQAEVAGQFLKKGRPCFIEGRLQLESWDDKQTGQKRSKLKVVCENLQFLGGKPGESNAPSQESSEPTPSAALQKQRSQAASGRPAPPRDPDLDAEQDDIPF